MLIVWLIIFAASLALLIKAADYFTESSEKIGLALKISPFIIGVTIVSIGTSLPELASSLVATLKGSTEIVAANAIGSNIANILLVVGISALVAGALVVRRSLIDLDLPLLACATVLIVFIIWDRQITFIEGIVGILGYFVYVAYTFSHRKEKEEKERLPATRIERIRRRPKIPKLGLTVFVVLIVSAVAIYFGAEYTIKSILKISELLKINASLVVMSAMAIGTSLPELVVSVQAARKKKYEMALGNVFGSNIFNILVVMGIPALIKPLVVDSITFSLGIPFIIAVTVLYVFSGISQKIHKWEGAMYLLIYALFLGKLFGAF